MTSLMNFGLENGINEKCNIMKKTLLFAIVLVASSCFANAQIKVVGDDYTKTLTGSKSYYDRDVDFDEIFPTISPQEHHGYMKPFLNDENLLCNLTGDTVLIIKDVYDLPEGNNTFHGYWNREKWSMVRRKHEYSFASKNDSLIALIPSGYYIISGYVFCDENTRNLLKRFGINDYNGESGKIKELKEEVLRYGKKASVKGFLDYVELTSLDGTTKFYINTWRNVPYSYMESALRDDVVLLRYYNEIKNKYIGKKVVCFEDNHGDWVRKTIGTIEKDALREEKFKLQDSIFVFKDVVLKNGHFYCILEGDKTGSFALEASKLTNVLYNGYDDYEYLQTLDDYIAEKKKERLSKQQREIEERQRKQLAEQEKVRMKEAFEQRMIEKYGSQNGNLVARKQVSIGMTKEMCRDAWGRPMNTYRTTTQYGQSEVWCYNYKTKVYFYNGKVVQIDD